MTILLMFGNIWDPIFHLLALQEADQNRSTWYLAVYRSSSPPSCLARSQSKQVMHMLLSVAVKRGSVNHPDFIECCILLHPRHGDFLLSHKLWQWNTPYTRDKDRYSSWPLALVLDFTRICRLHVRSNRVWQLKKTHCASFVMLTYTNEGTGERTSQRYEYIFYKI